MPLVVHASGTLLGRYQVEWSRRMDQIRKIQGDSHGHRCTTWFGQRWTTWLLWKEGVKPSDIHSRLSAIRGDKAPAPSTVFNWVWSFNIGRKTDRLADHEWYRNTTEELFCEHARELPRRWERYITKRKCNLEALAATDFSEVSILVAG